MVEEEERIHIHHLRRRKEFAGVEVLDEEEEPIHLRHIRRIRRIRRRTIRLISFCLHLHIRRQMGVEVVVEREILRIHLIRQTTIHRNLLRRKKVEEDVVVVDEEEEDEVLIRRRIRLMELLVLGFLRLKTAGMEMIRN